MDDIKQSDWDNDYNFINIYKKRVETHETWPEHRMEARYARKFLGEGYRMLDIGSAGGQAYFAFEDSVGEYVGIDICQPLIEFGNEYHKDNDKFTLYHVDVTKGVEDIGEFDLVIMNTVVAHVVDWKGFLHIAKSNLREGGYMMIRIKVTEGETVREVRTESCDDWKTEFTHHYIQFNIDELREFFKEDLGMEIVVDSDTPGPSYRMFVLKKV